MVQVSTSKNASETRYEVSVDGEPAGFAAYTLEGDDVVVLTHTEVNDRLEGQGVGSALARAALDDIRADGTRSVRPQCPFIRAWIARHPDYESLL